MDPVDEKNPGNPKPPFCRNRWVYLILMACVLALGLSSRRWGSYLPEFIKENSGDALWALLVFLGFGWLFSQRSTLFVGSLAMGFSTLIEISQLWHPPWLDAIRHTKLGGLILGFGFLWSDLVRYAVGIGLGMAGERLFLAKEQINKDQRKLRNFSADRK